MQPFIIIDGIGLFFIFLGLHVAVWRWGLPKNDYAALILIFFLVLIISYVIVFLNYASLSEWVLILLLHSALSGAYIASYPAIQVVSPSLKMICMIGLAMPCGMTFEELKRNFSEGELLELRVQDLVRSGLGVESEGVLRLTKKGVAFIWPFIFFRKLLGLPIGGG